MCLCVCVCVCVCVCRYHALCYKTNAARKEVWIIIIIRLLFYQFSFVFSKYGRWTTTFRRTLLKIFSFTIPPFVLNSPPKNAFVSHVLSTLFTHTRTRAHTERKKKKMEKKLEYEVLPQREPRRRRRRKKKYNNNNNNNEKMKMKMKMKNAKKNKTRIRKRKRRDERLANLRRS